MTNPSYQKIWHVISLIPAGHVASYGQVADLAGLPGRARLVAKALRAVPSEIQLPWHRVLRSSGEIAFPTESKHFHLQKGRLQEEGVCVNRRRVSIREFGWKPDLATLLFELEG
ncbi:MGMT family protein [Algicola sagamiensis]|uniref:MGMT family protein n=1 Tax=Algicola sagamiensis TaxID=163869 RepID=UPI00035DF564|nr:methylated-DNA--[protein]-cysteine S-methyltransferase [Algicola sagamiensis]